MESLLGYEEIPTEEAINGKLRGCKLVPWISWEEWDFVKSSLFSPCSDSVVSALNRISAWRCRGCVPDVVEVTASIIEIQQNDPFFRDGTPNDGLMSDEMRAMLYCMAILRLVNSVVEKKRKKAEASIGEAADSIGLPRMLIDIRHEGSHRDLPSLRLLRVASVKALDWLKAYYWEPQKRMIKDDKASSLKREINSALWEVLFCLRAKKTPQSNVSSSKAKRFKHCEQLCGRNKFFTLFACKKQSLKSLGSKRHLNKALKNFMHLYYSSCAEVVSILLEFLLEAVSLIELPNTSQDFSNTENSYSDLDELKHAIVKFSKKEPELLLNLLTDVLNMIETQKAAKYESGNLLSVWADDLHPIEQLSYLFEWLAKILNQIKDAHPKNSAAKDEVLSIESTFSNETLLKYLRKFLLVSSPGNTQVMDSALVLARATGDSSLVQRLTKLSSVYQPEPEVNEGATSCMSSETFFSQQEDAIREAARKLEFIKQFRTKRADVKVIDPGTENNSRWVVTRSWKACPIGMLPRDIGYSGHLPVLDNHADKEVSMALLKDKEQSELNLSQATNEADLDVEHFFCSKREAEFAIEQLDDSHVKRAKGMEGENLKFNEQEETSFEDVEGHLMINGVWKRVNKEELQAITSAVRIFA